MKPLVSARTPLLLTLGLLLAPAARAQTDLVALHPCNIVGEKGKQVEELQATCATEMARSDVQLVPSTQVRTFLDTEAKGSCTRAKKVNECLGKLAAATQASRAVLITLNPGQLTRASGVVVSPQGTVLDQKSIQIRSRGQSQGDLIRTALTRLREQLTLAPVKPAPLVEPAPPPLVATPEPAAPSTSTPPLAPPAPQAAPPEAIPSVRASAAAPTAWRKPVAYTSAGLGVVALGLAGFFAISGENAMVKSNAFYGNNTFPDITQLDQIAQLRQDAQNKRTLAGVSAAVGAVLVGTGAYLWLTDRPASPSPGTAALSVGPGGVGVHVLLP